MSSSRAAWKAAWLSCRSASLNEFGPVPMNWAGTPPATGSGSRSSSDSSDSSVSRNQSSMKRIWRSRTTGPCMRTVTSTHGAYFGLIANSASARLWLPA